MLTTTLTNPQRVEFHVPRTFDEETRPAAFSSTVLHEDPLPPNVMPQVPGEQKLNNVPFLLLDDPTSVRHFRGPNCPTTIDGFFKPGVPALQAHVGIYKGGILIGLTFPHLAFDAEGAGIILRAWAATTRGELDSVTPSPDSFCPLRAEELAAKAAELGERFESQRDHGFRYLPFLSLFIVILQLIWSIIRAGPQVTILVRIPKNWALEQKKLANAELAATTANGRDSNQPTFVSTNDILTAFLFKVRLFIFFFIAQDTADVQNSPSCCTHTARTHNYKASWRLSTSVALYRASSRHPKRSSTMQPPVLDHHPFLPMSSRQTHLLHTLSACASHSTASAQDQ